MMEKDNNEFVSYAQNFEDVVLYRALKDVEDGFYIDVGAYDPVADSITKAFYDIGWRGINIEPVSDLYEKLKKNRPEDINLQLVVGSCEGDVSFYEIPGTGLSTCDELVAKDYMQKHGFEVLKRKVATSSLTTICERYPSEEVHFLKIDGEGSELSILQGLDLKKIRPWVILVESTLPGTQIESHADWESIILAGDYEFIKFDGLNRFYVAKEHKAIGHLMLAPPNVFDGFVLSGTGSSSFHVGIAQIRDLRQACKQQCIQLEGKVESMDAEIRQHEYVLREKENLIDCLTNEKEIAMQQIDELNHASHHWRTVADGLNNELQSIYRSKLWRLNWPLRMLLQGIKAFIRFWRDLFIGLLRLPRRTLRWVLTRAIRFFLRREGLKNRAHRWLMRHPKLEAHLRAFACQRGLLPAVPNVPSYHDPAQQQDQTVSTVTVGDVSHHGEIDLTAKLTPRAKQIYFQLKAAIEQKQKANG